MSDAIASNGERLQDNFAVWFGQSKAIDPGGDPRKLFHSTYADFDAFERTRDVGFHFGSAFIAHKRIDESSNGRGRGDLRYSGVNLMPVFLRVENPFALLNDPVSWEPSHLLKLMNAILPQYVKARIEEDDRRAVETARKQGDELKAAGKEVIRRRQQWEGGSTFLELKNATWTRILAENRVGVYASLRKAVQAAGYDGLVYPNEIEGEGRGRKGRRLNADNLSWIAFEAHQVKSALGNAGLFLRNSPSLTDARADRDLRLAAQARSAIESMAHRSAMDSFKRLTSATAACGASA